MYLKKVLKEWLKGKEFGAGVAEGSKLGCFGHLWLEKRGNVWGQAAYIQSPTLALPSAGMLSPHWDSSSSSSQALLSHIWRSMDFWDGACKRAVSLGYFQGMQTTPTLQGPHLSIVGRSAVWRKSGNLTPLGHYVTFHQLLHLCFHFRQVRMVTQWATSPSPLHGSWSSLLETESIFSFRDQSPFPLSHHRLWIWGGDPLNSCF